MPTAKTLNGLSSPARPNGSFTEKDQMKQATSESAPRLDERFAALKREIIKPEDEAAVAKSYEKLKDALAAEADRIDREQQSSIPEVEWSDVVNNGNAIPPNIASKARSAGCIIFRNVVAAEQALAWKAELEEYAQRHRAVGGHPVSNPVFWLLYWTRPQVQARSHPSVLAAMHATSKLWHVSDPTLPVDLASQIVYADRFRIRKPGDTEFTLKPHLDSSAIERWEDPTYRSNYAPIFVGEWKSYDPWCINARVYAKTDLYHERGSCSAFRAMQGWLSLSNCGPGEGTLRLLPSLQLSTAYIMLRPFFVDHERFDASQPTFPGATPGRGQFFPTSKWHPHLQLEKTIVSVPRVGPGDYVFWHADLVHEVEGRHYGLEDSSVIYNANVPLCPYNIQNMMNMRKAFREAVPPADFYLDCGGPYELEKVHSDHGAREENILTLEGRRALGLADFDADEAGLTEGQTVARRMANEARRSVD